MQWFPIAFCSFIPLNLYALLFTLRKCLSFQGQEYPQLLASKKGLLIPVIILSKLPRYIKRLSVRSVLSIPSPLSPSTQQYRKYFLIKCHTLNIIKSSKTFNPPILSHTFYRIKICWIAFSCSSITPLHTEKIISCLINH